MRLLRLALGPAAMIAAAACAGPSAPPAPGTPPQPVVNCQVTASMAATSFPGHAGVTKARVTATDPSCRWTIVTPPWMTPAYQIGYGTADVSISLSDATDARSGEVVVGTSRISVTQDRAYAMFYTARCRTAAAGRNTGVCTVSTRHGVPRRVTVDLRAFGGSAEWDLLYITASSGEYDLDLAIPAGFPAGTVTLVFTGTDAGGKTETITAPLEVR